MWKSLDRGKVKRDDTNTPCKLMTLKQYTIYYKSSLVLSHDVCMNMCVFMCVCVFTRRYTLCLRDASVKVCMRVFRCKGVNPRKRSGNKHYKHEVLGLQFSTGNSCKIRRLPITVHGPYLEEFSIVNFSLWRKKTNFEKIKFTSLQDLIVKYCECLVAAWLVFLAHNRYQGTQQDCD